MKRALACLALILAACTPAPGPGAVTPGPTPTLRNLPTITASPVFPTALPTDTPAPSPTPLPTATPMVHLIQSGDTLIAIAVKYDVSLEALEAANPGISPQSLQLGQPVIVPAAEGQAAPAGGIAPTPLPVEVGPFSCAPTPVGSLLCLGEFVNGLDQPVANLSVKVTLLNADDTAADSQIAYAPLDWIPPGAAVPLGAVFATGNQRAAVAQVLAADSGAGLADRFVLLPVSDVAGLSTTGGFTLSGTLANPTAGEVQHVILVGTVYNSAGSVAGYRQIALEQPMPPGANASFSITLPGVLSAARWAVLAQGRNP